MHFADDQGGLFHFASVSSPSSVAAKFLELAAGISGIRYLHICLPRRLATGFRKCEVLFAPIWIFVCIFYGMSTFIYFTKGKNVKRASEHIFSEG
jgi:Na+/proline symporter